MKPLHILLFGVILSACSSTIVPPPTSTAPTINTPRATTIPYTPTSSQSPTATPKNWPISTIPSCTTMDVMKSIPDDYQISGAMLSINSPSWSLSTMPEPKYEIGESRLLHFDLPTRIETDFVVLKNYQEEIKTKIEFLQVGDLFVSPDNIKVVYAVGAYNKDFEHKKTWLEIYYADTGKKARIPWKDDWAYIIGWINNENIAIRAGGSTLFLDADGIVKNRIHTSQFPDYSNPRTYNPLAFVLWGGYREFESYSFIGPASIGQRKNSRIYNPALEIYDPSMEYVIYTEVVDNIPGIVLFHIVSQQKIVEIITGNKVEPFAFGGEPVWSPDGSSALMLLPTTQYSNNQSLFLFNISGEVQKITNFEIIGPYQWSPDGSYVAFWLENGKEIGILDMDAKSMKVYCMDGDYAYYIYSPTTDKIPTGGDLVWLPNNKQLLVEGVKVISKDPYTYTRVISIADIEKELFIDLKWNAIHPIWLNE